MVQPWLLALQACLPSVDQIKLFDSGGESLRVALNGGLDDRRIGLEGDLAKDASPFHK